MGVYLPIKDYSAMQGPAPDGFHVPLNTERQAVYDIRTALGGGSSDGTNFGIALKLPFAGARGRTNGSTNSQGTMGAYYSSVRKTNTYAYFLVFTSSVLLPQNADYYSNAYSIRPFKDTATIPTSSWTKLYGTSIEAGGIFWSSTDGLISLSSDGNTWITIADKNLGATTVWNSGNTLSEANSGKYYQWGNNYGFPFTGSVTTSSSQVNAQNYGPGNYYNSSTFITYSSGWDSSDNWNLRGGVTGAKPMSELKNAYIGEYIAHRTFTISWTEQSNMSSGWTYSDDAAGLTAGSTAFDEFFGYSAVLLDDSGTEVAEVTQSSAGVLNLSQLGTLTGANNVMIKFPRRGIKMSKSGSQVTLSITTDPNKSGYTYYAFNRDGTAVNQFYVGAFKGTSNSSKLRSWATNAKPTVSRSITDFRNTDVITGYGSSSHYSLITLPIRNYVNALYMMKYGNPDSQSVIGQGYTGGSAAQVLGTTVTGISGNLATGATNTSSTGRVRLFGLEDWWGNIYEWVDGIYGNYVNMTNNPSKLKELGNTSYGWESLGSATSISGNITSIVGNDKGMFFPSACSGSDYTTFYCDRGYVYASNVANAGGTWDNASYAGAFLLHVAYSATDAYTSIGARLMFL